LALHSPGIGKLPSPLQTKGPAVVDCVVEGSVGGVGGAVVVGAAVVGAAVVGAAVVGAAVVVSKQEALSGGTQTSEIGSKM